MLRFLPNKSFICFHVVAAITQFQGMEVNYHGQPAVQLYVCFIGAAHCRLLLVDESGLDDRYRKKMPTVRSCNEPHVARQSLEQMLCRPFPSLYPRTKEAVRRVGP